MKAEAYAFAQHLQRDVIPGWFSGASFVRPIGQTITERPVRITESSLVLLCRTQGTGVSEV